MLELGFGDDRWTEKLVARFGHSHVVDASEQLLETARAKYGARIHTYHSFFEEFAPPLLFNTVVASYVLEHVTDAVVVLRRAAEWLAPGGHVIAVVPHADSLHRRLAVCMGLQPITTQLGPTDAKLGHRRVHTIEHMEREIAAAGLRVVRKRGTLCKPLPQGMMTGLSEQQLQGFMKLGDEMPMEYASSISFDCVRADG